MESAFVFGILCEPEYLYKSALSFFKHYLQTRKLAFNTTSTDAKYRIPLLHIYRIVIVQFLRTYKNTFPKFHMFTGNLSFTIISYKVSLLPFLVVEEFSETSLS